MSRVLLIYPFFKPSHDRSIFRFPPLGIASLAASLKQAGHFVSLLDCTFMDRKQALRQAMESEADVVGIYCMVTMTEDCIWFAKELRATSRLLVAGGPLPTCDPGSFLDHFDVIVRGEGESTIIEMLKAFAQGKSFEQIPGLAYRKNSSAQKDTPAEITLTAERPFLKNLDSLPLPDRSLLPNQAYIQHTGRKYGYSITTIMSTRGCPYDCDFCSNVVFGGSYRERSLENVFQEIEQVLGLGYERISFADDVFSMKPRRVIEFCKEIKRRGLKFNWECLGRVDSLDYPTMNAMREAGCWRIFFGIESGNDEIIKIMNKHITREQAKSAVEAASQAGLQVGAFIILFYPGESNATILETLHFTTTLPLDYLGLSMPYPLPGTRLYSRIKDQIKRDWHPGESVFGNHVLIYNSQFSEAKMQFGIFKGQVQFRIKKQLKKLAPYLITPFERITDRLFLMMS